MHKPLKLLITGFCGLNEKCPPQVPLFNHLVLGCSTVWEAYGSCRRWRLAGRSPLHWG